MNWIENLVNFENLGEILYWYVLPLLLLGLYTLYVKKFKFYKLYEKFDSLPIRNKLPRGKCPPVYPWGWYRLCRTNEIKPG
jgi:cholesterol 7-dehydrogenase